MESQTPSTDKAPGVLHRIWNSIFPSPFIPTTDQQRRRYLVKNLIFHFRPATVPEKTLKFNLTWGLGGMAAVLVTLQLTTGLLLKFAYAPTPVLAYASVQAMQAEVPFGQLIRNLHHWCANLLVIIAFLHMLRIFFTGAFHPPRQFNWIVGLAMFGVVLVANFTGYLLPYDQLAYWAVTVFIGMLEYIPVIGARLQYLILGGPDPGPATLRMFFAIHTAVVPLMLIGIMAFHFWRVRKAGGLVIPRAPNEELDEKPNRVTTLPNLFVREVTVALVLVAAVMLAAVLFNAPLEEPANPGLSPNPTKAPWYFAGLQELVLHFHPTFAVFVVPLLAGIALFGLPYLNYPSSTEGIWFASRKGRRISVVAAAAALAITPVLVVLDDLVIEPAQWFAGMPPVIGNGVIPVGFALAAVSGFYLLLKRRFSATQNEAVQAVFVLLVMAFVVLTVIGAFFRGVGMKLMLPW